MAGRVGMSVREGAIEKDKSKRMRDIEASQCDRESDVKKDNNREKC